MDYQCQNKKQRDLPIAKKENSKQIQYEGGRPSTSHSVAETWLASPILCFWLNFSIRHVFHGIRTGEG